MGEVKLKTLFLGNANAFLLAFDNEVALIDCGLGDKSSRIIAEARTMVENFSCLKYIFVTHAHYDHVGSLAALKKIFPQALVVAQKFETGNLINGESPVPKGTMWLFRQISWLGCLIFRSCIRFNGVVPDCVVYERLKLPFGNGFFECIHTPGHTRGSMSVRFDHMLFAGDTFFHLLPGSIFPPFANDVKTLRKSWSKIARSGIKKIFPGHGKVFSIKLLSQQEK